MKTTWGICALNHDASITVMREDRILFAGHSERYSRIKNDPFIHDGLVAAALRYGNPKEVIWFEKPLVKKLRQAYAGQWSEVQSVTPKDYLQSINLPKPTKYISHHKSHAAAGYYTSNFTDAAVIVVDAIGEWETITVWHGRGSSLSKVSSRSYPDSLGLLYSAVTHRCNLKPNEEEYILMGMAAYGSPIYYDSIKNDFISDCTAPNFTLKENVHRGIKWWRPEISTEQDFMNLAASIQKIAEEFMCDLARYARKKTNSKNLVIMGGCALNCVANEKIARLKIFDDIWIMPNPGDAGSSLGCILAHKKIVADWATPYLGTNIKSPFDADSVVDNLVAGEVIGVAHGKAEFGPRALGNRSILADPRGNLVKDRVNDIKHRQRFRPFAPMILEELADSYFDMPVSSSPYMQFTARCLNPELYPAICHVDGSSRVQTLNKTQNPVMYNVLKRFYDQTGCPMLLNTSLNIKGQPLVDTRADAQAFQERYNIKVF